MPRTRPARSRRRLALERLEGREVPSVSFTEAEPNNNNEEAQSLDLQGGTDFTVAGSLANTGFPADSDVYAFELPAATPVTVSVHLDLPEFGPGDVEVNLYNLATGQHANGYVSGSKADWPNVVGLTTGAAGRWYIQFYEQGGSSAETPYVLTVAAAAPPAVEVRAKYDADPAAGTFGTYLSGVKLPNVFTASTPAEDTRTKKFRFSIDGVPDATKTLPRAVKGTAFKFDTGLLAANPDGSDRDYAVKVEALDQSGVVVSTFTGTIKIKGRLELDLKVKATIDSRAPQPVENARLIAGIARGPALDFRSAITGEISTFYQGRLALTFFEAGTDKVARQYALQTIQGGQGTLAGPVKGNDFKDVVSEAQQFDYDVVLTPGKNFQVGKTPYRFDDAEHLRVVAQPEWLRKNATGKGAGKYVADADTAEQYGAGAAAYKFVVDTGKAFNLPLPLTTGTPFDVLNKLKSGVELEANFTVYAPLFEDHTPKVVADAFNLSATLLGDPVFDAELDSDKFAVTAALDARTLDEPTSVTVATNGPVDLLPLFTGGLSFERRFGPWKVDVPIFTAGFASLDGTVTIKGTFNADVYLLDLSGSVTFKFQDGKIALDQTVGNLMLDVLAKATATLGASASVSVNVFGYKVVDLVTAQGTGSVTLDLSARVAGTFGGPKGISIDTTKTRADLTLGYSFDYDVSFLTRDPGDPSDMEHAQDSKTGSIWDLSV